ncbi:hypothetical protein EPO33_03560 [Patescibacteria group bacterium]|nr:MAG: hypothetical protein EPO33_03560 [Patescibacteria group bacterium]
MRNALTIALFCVTGCATSHAGLDPIIPAPDAAMADPDAGPSVADAGWAMPDVPVAPDAGLPTEDAGSPAIDAGVPESDAGLPVEPLLTVALDSLTPVAVQLVMGSVANETFRIRLTSGPETVTFTQTALLIDISHRGTIWNIRYMDAERGTFPAGTLAALPSDGPVLFSSSGTFVLPPHTTAVIKIVVDVTSDVDGGFSGERFRFGFGPDARMEAYVGLDGRMLAPEQVRVEGAGADGAIWGSWMTIYRTKVAIAKSASSPAGPTSSSADQIVARFIYSNSANVGSYSASVEGITLNVGSTIVAGSPRTIRVWKDVAGVAGNLLAEYTVPAGERLRSPPSDLRFATGIAIAAGTSRDFIVTADTRDAVAGNRLTVSLSRGSAGYTDGVTHDIQSDSLPIAGNTLEY